MIPRNIKIQLWNAPGRATYLRCLDRLNGVFARSLGVTGPDPYGGQGCLHDATFSEGVMKDKKRNITVGYEIFRPQDLRGKLPVIVFSRGMHFSESQPAPRSLYLAEHFAAHGYIVMHLRHDDADAVFLPKPTDDREELVRLIGAVYRDWVDEPDRALDISFAIDTLEAWDEGGSPLSGHIDLSRIGVSGYSFGVRTAMAAIGEQIGPKRRSFKDARIRAAILYSVALGWEPGDARAVFEDVDVPILHMAGTRDRAYADPLIPEDKLGAYEGISAPHQYALRLKRADHMVFSGERPGGVDFPTDARHRQLIKSAALAFWDAYLKGDERARHWLDEDFPRVLGREGRFKRK